MRAVGISAAALLVCLAATVPAPTAEGRSENVYVVGDSLEVGTGPYLSRLLPGLTVRVDADESRSSSAGEPVISERLRGSDDIVVFDLGTNDDPSRTNSLAANLAAVSDLVGNSCLVVATIHRPPAGGVSYDGLNQVIRGFAQQRQNTRLVDWGSFAAAHPDLLYSDGVHPTAAGYQFRARLIAEGIESCLVAAASAAPPATANAAPQVNRLQRLLHERALAARLLAVEYLKRLEDLARAPGDRATAFLLPLATLVAQEPEAAGEANRRSRERPGSRRRSPPRRSPRT
jgi:GDSL-like lipase/acylhydrolase family protein